MYSVSNFSDCRLIAWDSITLPAGAIFRDDTEQDISINV